MVDENIVYNYLQHIAIQIVQQQQRIEALTNVVAHLKYSSNGQLSKVLPFGVKDITTVQLVDAYQRGLNLEQLTELANGKYTPEQIKQKIFKATGGRRRA